MNKPAEGNELIKECIHLRSSCQPRQNVQRLALEAVVCHENN